MAPQNTDFGRGFGLHLMLEGYEGSPQSLSSKVLVKKALLQIPELLSMKRLTDPVIVDYDGGENPKDRGVSGFVIIAESHVSIHTFPEKGFLTADVHSCKYFDSKEAVNFLKKIFRLKRLEINVVERGHDFPRTEPQFVTN